jgi:hypothetical protein
MKQILFFAFLLAAFSSCRQIRGSGNIVTETRATGNFTGVSAGGAYEVEIKNGPVTEVKVEADDNIIKYIETRVSGNTLHIETRDGVNFNDGHFKVYVTAPEINNIHSSGAASIAIRNILKNDKKITLEASGAAGINGEVDAPEIEAEASGASNIKVSGHTRNYKAEASGSADLETGELMSETTKIHTSGAASAHVYSSISLNADASGAGSINYSGAGTTVVKTSGAASVKKSN